MITYVDGYLLQSPAQTLVNTVNTVGVMGKGIAKEFKEALPEMYNEYRRLCELGKFRTGMLWTYKSEHKWVLNFPTKQDWRRPSKVEYIEQGLRKFVESYQQMGITSIAFPALGCGNGGLDWPQVVKPLMERYLKSLPLQVYIYPHQQSAGLPEHETPKEIAHWMRSQPSVLSFHGFWMNIEEQLRARQEYSLASGQTINISFGEDELVAHERDCITKFAKEDMLDLWQQLRRTGFASATLTPASLEGRVDCLLPLLMELSYLRKVGVRTDYEESSKPGVQFLPPASDQSTNLPPKELVLQPTSQIRPLQPVLL